MKKWQIYMMALGTFGTICCANAQDSTTTVTQNNNMASGPLPDSDSRLYRDQEFSVDLAAVGSINQDTINHYSNSRVQHNGLLGGGGGLNFFFCRYLGIGGDAYIESTPHDHFLDSASGNLIVRLPIADSGIAPYAFGGGGHEFDAVDQNFAQGGAGIEFRFTQHTGIFVDARYVFADKTQNYGVARAGLRVSF